LSPLPLVVLTTLAPGHSESGPGAFWTSKVESRDGELSCVLSDSSAGALAGELAGALAGELAGALAGALLGGLLASGVPRLGSPPSHCSTVIV
jgi:hypothetical protein